VRWLEAVVERGQNPGAQSQPVLVLALPGGARVEIAGLKQVCRRRNPISQRRCSICRTPVLTKRHSGQSQVFYASLNSF
jgi:hypothetical protein